MTTCKPPQSLDLDGLPIQMRLALLIEKHGPSTRPALRFWARVGTGSCDAFDFALASRLFYFRDGRFHLSPHGEEALRQHREKR